MEKKKQKKNNGLQLYNGLSLDTKMHQKGHLILMPLSGHFDSDSTRK